MYVLHITEENIQCWNRIGKLFYQTTKLTNIWAKLTNFLLSIDLQTPVWLTKSNAWLKLITVRLVLVDGAGGGSCSGSSSAIACYSYSSSKKTVNSIYVNALKIQIDRLISPFFFVYRCQFWDSFFTWSHFLQVNNYFLLNRRCFLLLF